MDTKKIKQYVITLAVFLAVDSLWILVVARSFYDEQLSGFARPEIVPLWSVAMAWAVIPLGIVMFVHPISKTKKSSLVYGALFGFILYGVYDFTNYATLANFSLEMLVVDILWGTCICSISSGILKVVDETLLK